MIDKTVYLLVLTFLFLSTSSLVDYGTVEMYAAMNISNGYKALIAFCLGALFALLAIALEAAIGLRPGSGMIKGMLGVSFPTPKIDGFDRFLPMAIEMWAIVFAAAQFDSAITIALNLQFNSLLFKFMVTFLGGSLGVFVTVVFAILMDPSQRENDILVSFK